MEDALGQDLGDVRIHRRSERADDREARAFAEGSEIHFAPGEFSPATGEGRELLIHELVHVAQNQLADQGQGRPASQGDRETEARQIANAGAGSPEVQGAPRQPQYDLRSNVDGILVQRRDDKGLLIVLRVELASAEDVRAVLADVPTMRRISGALSRSLVPLFREAAARRLAASGAYGEAFGLLAPQQRRRDAVPKPRWLRGSGAAA